MDNIKEEEITLIAHWGIIVQPEDGSDAYAIPNEDWQDYKNHSFEIEVD